MLVQARKRHAIVLTPGTEDVDQIYEFLEDSGAQWGARREVVERATSVLVELYESISISELADGPIKAQATFDEFRLDLLVGYRGRPLDLSGGTVDPFSLLHDEPA